MYEFHQRLAVAPPVGRRPTRTHQIVKRGIDIVGSALGLALLSPVILLVALAVKLERPDAPVLFRQERCGRRGRPFVLLKFRSMIPGAAAMKEKLRAQSAVAWPDFRLERDPRVTRIGRFLRKTSLDELPQLWNVLRGDMSLVGPRPTSFMADTYDLWQTERLEFRPGLTGPWQVLGRDSMDFIERCRLEITFFRHTTLLKELAMLLRTVPVLIRRTGVA